MKNSNNNSKRLQRKRRIRAKISGTAERPRLAVFKSLTAISAQVIDDAKGVTLCSVQLGEVKGSKNTIEGAKMIGALVAEKCKILHITSVVFDRAGYQYHGKVKALAEGAREAGLEF